MRAKVTGIRRSISGRKPVLTDGELKDCQQRQIDEANNDTKNEKSRATTWE
jgi:hypothetical protein